MSIRHRLYSLRYKVGAWLTRRALDLVVWLNRDSNYLSHVRREVPSWFSEEGPNRWIADGTVDLLAVLASQGHSGGSIHFALNFFKTMGSFEPWGPLTGEDHEWGEPFTESGTQQNKRCSHVFKDADGNAYDGQGKVFTEPGGCSYTSRDSRVPVTFPYTPKTEYVKVPA